MLLQSLKNRLRRDWLLYTVVAAIVLIVAGTIIGARIYSKRADSITMAPGFALRDQNGRLTSLAQYHGKVVVLAFIDPQCTQLCPLTTRSMVDALNMLGPAASQVQLLGLNVNPDATSLSDVALYTREHQMQGRWRFLTGSVAQLTRIWKAYHVYVATKDGDVAHEAVVYVIGPDGQEDLVSTTDMSYGSIGDQAQELANGIAPLLPGHATVNTSLAPPHLPALTASQSLQLSPLGMGGQTVTIGHGHPHLLLFFTSWLSESTNLPQRLAMLNQYAALARKNRWPAPVAVDETTIEPPSPATQHHIYDLATGLKVPVVADSDGRVADGYHVADMPWFVLTSKSGKVLWHHDGWLKPAELNLQVRSALAKN